MSQAPEIQTMYNVPFPVSVIRTRIREEFERNRFVNKLPIVDILLFKSDAEYQVRGTECRPGRRRG
jgi:NADH dehydrogenase (ubiquinone) 1 alpha subcomplex subunit 6